MEIKHYTAQEGKTYRRKVDGYIMGNNMYLAKFIDGTDDVIENYEEIDDPDYVAPEDSDSDFDNTNPREIIKRRIQSRLNNVI